MLKDVRRQLKAHIPLFLFLAVWVPCCTSDIVFPLLFAKAGQEEHLCAPG